MVTCKLLNAMNYNIQKGEKLNFRPIKRIPEGLPEFLTETLGDTATVTSFCILNRTKGFLGLNKLPTIILFYKGSIEFEKDNVLISSNLSEYFENVDYYIDLIALDLSDDATLEIGAGIENMGVKITKVKNA
jgi:hypothetical protein